MTGSATSESGRFVEVDLLKAAGLLAVVLIHSVRSRWDPAQSEVERFLIDVLRFGVPAFLASSGFLYATQASVPRATTGRRLVRVLVPYLLASCGAQLLWVARGVGRPWPTVASDFALANSFGHYYYVFIITGLILATPLFAKCSSRTMLVVFGLALVAQLAAEADRTLTEGLFWRVRDPLKWAAYFLAGWWVRLRYDDARDRVAALGAGPILACAVVACVCWLAAARLPLAPAGVTVWIGIWAVLAALFVRGAGLVSTSLLRELSDATYAIFLLHVFFIEVLQGYVRGASGVGNLLAPVVLFVVSLLGSYAVVVAARGVLGERSRVLLGA